MRSRCWRGAEPHLELEAGQIGALRVSRLAAPPTRHGSVCFRWGYRWSEKLKDHPRITATERPQVSVTPQFGLLDSLTTCGWNWGPISCTSKEPDRVLLCCGSALIPFPFCVSVFPPVPAPQITPQDAKKEFLGLEWQFCHLKLCNLELLT